MDAADLIPLAINSTAKLFGEEQGIEGEAAMLSWLEQKLQHMLERDFNSLLNLLYRIDVSESKAKSCFGKANNEIAKCLAALVWERQLQKAKSRLG